MFVRNVLYHFWCYMDSTIDSQSFLEYVVFFFLHLPLPFCLWLKISWLEDSFCFIFCHWGEGFFPTLAALLSNPLKLCTLFFFSSRRVWCGLDRASLILWFGGRMGFVEKLVNICLWFGITQKYPLIFMLTCENGLLTATGHHLHFI